MTDMWKSVEAFANQVDYSFRLEHGASEFDDIRKGAYDDQDGVVIVFTYTKDDKTYSVFVHEGAKA